MRWLLELIRALIRSRPKLVRPWALSAPILILLITLPLLRPLRHPHFSSIGDDERATLATVQALAEQGTQSIDNTAFVSTVRKIEMPGAPAGARLYADQPPTLAFLLSGAYRVLMRLGLSFAMDAPRVEYWLTFLAAALPAAVAAGLIYRMARLFELRRPLRALLAASAVLATGTISYATVLNSHVPAAMLVLASAACLMHLATAIRRPIPTVWLFAAGLFAALAAAIDAAAVPFLPLLLIVVLGYRWPHWKRAVGMLAFMLGTAGPIALHAALTMPVTGNFFHGYAFGPAPVPAPVSPTAPPWALSTPSVNPPDASPEDLEEPKTGWRVIGQTAGSILAALAGSHGLLSHFPILALVALGVTMVMHRHWPTAAKVLAASTLAGALVLLVLYAVHRPPGVGWRDAMYAARWFIVFGPLLLFWAGAWLRRRHRPASWTVAGVLLTFSIAVGVIGAAAGPWPRSGFSGYTFAEAWNLLWRGGGTPTTEKHGTAVTHRPASATPAHLALGDG